MATFVTTPFEKLFTAQSETEALGSPLSLDLPNSVDGGDNSTDRGSTSSPSPSSFPSSEICVHPRTKTAWTAINKDREIKWETTGPLNKPNMATPQADSKPKPKPSRKGGPTLVTWNAFIDDLRRHEANLNMTAGRKKKALALAKERAREDEKSNVDAAKRKIQGDGSGGEPRLR
jgi:hypothetical protein